MLQAGVRYLKVPGRSSSALAAVRLLRRLLDGGDLSPPRCREVVGSPSFCAGGENCYYDLGHAPEVAGGSPASRQDPPAGGMQVAGTEPVPRAEPAPASAPALASTPVSVPAIGPPELAIYVSCQGWPAALPAALRSRGLATLLDPAPGGSPWEPAPRRRTVELLERRSLAAPPTRVHLGLELCALRLPDAQQLRREIDAWRSEGYAVSLVLPVAYQAVWERLTALVDALLAWPGSVAELVVNDLGLLEHAARRWDVPLATGRLFYRMKRDPFAADPTVLPAAEGTAVAGAGASGGSDSARREVRRLQQAAYGHPYLGEPGHLDWLAARRVSSIGLDALPTPLSASLPARFAHALHLPWTYLTSSRACPVAAALEGHPLSHPLVHCGQPCRGHALVHTYPWEHAPIVQRGNALFLDCSETLDAFLDSAGRSFERYVLEPFLPW